MPTNSFPFRYDVYNLIIPISLTFVKEQNFQKAMEHDH